MAYRCEICNEEYHYRDEVVLLDCNGNNSPQEEYGGSGDIYGCVCATCYEDNCEAIINNVSIFGKVNK